MEANHSKNPIRERESAPLYNFAQPYTLQTKEFLIFWIANSLPNPPSLNANRFLSFQTVQKINNGMDLQIFFLFLPTNEPFQLRTTSFKVSRKIHWALNKPRTISHSTLATVQ